MWFAGVGVPNKSVGVCVMCLESCWNALDSF